MKNFMTLAILSVFILGSNIQAQTKHAGSDKQAGSDKPSKPSHVVTQGSLDVFKIVPGYIAPQSSRPIETKFLRWSSLKIKTVRPEGESVKAGDVVLDLDSEALSRELSQAEQAVKSAELALESAELESRLAKQKIQIEQDLAERKFKQLQEDFEYRQKTLLPQRMKELEFSTKGYKYRVETAEEDLAQLKKMYLEDELTEESEAIVLKRSERGLESAKFSLAQNLLRTQFTTEVEIPRETRKLEAELALAKIAFEKSRVALDVGLKKTRIDAAKAAFALDEAKLKLQELQNDMQQMTLKSPAAGVLLYGEIKRGKLVGSSGTSKRSLEIGQKLSNDQVVLSIAKASNPMIVCDVDEALAGQLEAGTACQILIDQGKRKTTVGGKVMKVGVLPMDNGKYNVEIEFEKTNQALQLMFGRKVTCSINVYSNSSAMLLPKDQVHLAEDGISEYVWQIVDGKKTKVTVQTGQQNSKNVEILSGLKVGDKVGG